MWVAADGQDLVPGQQRSVELQTKVTEDSRRFHNHEEGPSRAFSWLKALSHLRHYAKQMFTQHSKYM